MNIVQMFVIARRKINIARMCKVSFEAASKSLRSIRYLPLLFKYYEFTMVSAYNYWHNLLIVDDYRRVEGCVIECGVWRGGMAAGIAEVLGPKREYFLFDSFEGLPPATDLDGDAAKAWQKNTESTIYYDNCRAEIDFAERAMRMSGVPNHKIIKGWFDKTIPEFVPPCPIAVLRLDGDWYESTIIVLEALFKHLARDGVVIIDDYYTWDGCSRAVHDFLSHHKLPARVTQKYGVCILQLR